MNVAEKYKIIHDIAVVPLLNDYRNGMSFRDIFKVHGVCYKTAREIVEMGGIKVRQNDGQVYEERRSEVIDTAAKEYQEGIGMRTIQSKYKIRVSTFKRYLEARGVPVRCAQIQRFPHLTEAMRVLVTEDFSSGMFMADIAKKHSITKSSVKTLLRHAGIRRRSKSETSAIGNCTKQGTKDIPGYVISQWKGSAKTGGRDWNLTPEYLQSLFDAQRGLCYYTGIPMIVTLRRGRHGSKRVNPLRMSLDRIDSSGDYTVGNVVLCATFANYAKMDFPATEFEQLLRMAGEYQLSKVRENTTVVA